MPISHAIEKLEDEFRDVHREIEGMKGDLETQFTRIGQIQAEFDRLRAATTRPLITELAE
jgi:hypothetical protein